MDWLSVKNTLGQNYQMFVTMRTKKTSWDKTAIFLSVWRQKQKKTTKEQSWAYILDTIESESTTRFKNRSSDHMMTSDWLVDVSDDRCTTTFYIYKTSKNDWNFISIHLPDNWTEYTSTSENLEQVPVTIKYGSNRKSTNPDLPANAKRK